ncbi:hypothetical protein IscW_ISCW022165 [Ixodes scapularis]|uniref:Uncharacterized protein n=1 Tax=Ixodes scapularis TaxID=6945 RepID=B7QD06_IXOSC|nr:hypothetical protein IscW_ISCW022165 [Ixodes scapularis]|eukprot:XP_002413420.1 hypothetical protein IscW_ISCW022165 [Ixodes scapularis]
MPTSPSNLTSLQNWAVVREKKWCCRTFSFPHPETLHVFIGCCKSEELSYVWELGTILGQELKTAMGQSRLAYGCHAFRKECAAEGHQSGSKCAAAAVLKFQANLRRYHCRYRSTRVS